MYTACSALMTHQTNVVGGHPQAPVGIVNPTPRTNNKTLSTMDLRLLTTQYVPEEQKQLFRLSAPICPNNYQVNNGQNHNGENKYDNKRNESRSNDQFRSSNDASTLFNVPENAINKSKSNMDISSYHRLQQIRMAAEGYHTNCTSNKCACNGSMMNPYTCFAPQNHHGNQNNQMCCLSQPILMGSSFPISTSDNMKSNKFRFA